MVPKLLQALVEERYAPQAIPGPRDGDIASLVSAARSPEGFDALASSLDLAAARILNLFAKRAASQAVRTGDVSWVRFGLAAVLLSSTAEDYREIARTNSILYRAAELVGADPVDLFDSAAEIASSEAAETARLFARADESARSIGVMGYAEGTDDDGFRFMSTW
jgi:hypothetical protein